MDRSSIILTPLSVLKIEPTLYLAEVEEQQSPVDEMLSNYTSFKGVFSWLIILFSFIFSGSQISGCIRLHWKAGDS